MLALIFANAFEITYCNSQNLKAHNKFLLYNMECVFTTIQLDLDIMTG